MKKKDIIIQIRSARASHIRWKSMVNIALRGIVIKHTDDILPIVQTECEFGKWYYGEGMALSLSQYYQDLEYPHEALHEVYIQIFTLQKAKLRGGFFISKKKLLRKRDEEIKRLLMDFNDFSRIIIETLKQLEMEVLNMSDHEIDNLINMENDSSDSGLSEGFDLLIKKID